MRWKRWVKSSVPQRALVAYRAVATRHDKLAAMFLGGMLATLLAVSLKCIVNTS